ncbi:MAG: KGG domain-containing protein [Chitinophagaceae bacterium]
MQENTNIENASQTPETKSRRGFASMDPERQKVIASQGGRVAHQLGLAHKWTSEEARNAGKKGGQNSHARGRNGNAGGESHP